MALLCGREKQTTTWGHGAQGLQGDPQARPANQRALQAQSGASPGAPPARPPRTTWIRPRPLSSRAWPAAGTAWPRSERLIGVWRWLQVRAPSEHLLSGTVREEVPHRFLGQPLEAQAPLGWLSVLARRGAAECGWGAAAPPTRERK